MMRLLRSAFRCENSCQAGLGRAVASSLVPLYLAQAKLEDVFKSTQENFQSGPDPKKLLAVLVAAVGVVLLLVLISQRKKREVTPRALNSPGKLLREVTRNLPIRSAELKQLKVLADQQQCSSPLVLLLCPSLLAKGLQSRNVDRRIVGRITRKVGADK